MVVLTSSAADAHLLQWRGGTKMGTDVRLEAHPSIVALQDLSAELRSIKFHNLKRPLMRTARSEQESRWALRVYLSCSIPLFCDMIQGYCSLSSAGNQAASFLPTRFVFELSAHAAHIRLSIAEPLKQKDFDGVWAILLRANVGTIYMNKHTEFAKERKTSDLAKVDPIRIETIIKSLDKIHPSKKGAAFVDYSLLSEYSHPNAMALRQYFSADRKTEGALFHPARWAPDATVHLLAAYSLLYVMSIKYLLQMAEMHTAGKTLDRAASKYMAARE
jgi:hypothetical protein